MSKAIDRFAVALKTKLREVPPNDIAYQGGAMGSTLTGWMADEMEIDWDRLDKEIDELCAQFKGKQ